MLEKTGALLLLGALVASISMAAEVPQGPQPAETLLEAVTGGKLLLNVRPRYESVEQDGKREDANAFTNRLLAGWRTLPFHGFSLTAEVINVSRLGDQNYNDTPIASPRFPSVADPEITDFNQLYLEHFAGDLIHSA